MADVAATKASKGKASKVRERSPEDLLRMSVSSPHAHTVALQQTLGNQAFNQLLQAHTSRESTSISTLPDTVQTLLSNSQGQPLDTKTRAEMESRFNHNFSQVRIHSGTDAERSTHELNARGYTFDQNIVFAPGQFEPETSKGKYLLAHELAHVVQQKRGGPSPFPVTSASHELAANTAAADVMTGQSSVSVAGATSVGIACAPKDDDFNQKNRDRNHRKQEMRDLQLADRGFDDIRDDDRTGKRHRDEQRKAARRDARQMEKSELEGELSSAGRAVRKLREAEATAFSPSGSQRSHKRKEQLMNQVEQAHEILNETVAPVESSKKKAFVAPQVRQKGRIDEAMRTSQRPGIKVQQKYVAGTIATPQHDLPPRHSKYSQPDQSEGTLHTNFKSDKIHKLTVPKAVKRIREHVKQAQKNVTRDLPKGDTVKLNYLRTPSEDHQKAMLKEAFKPGSGISQVQFGTTVHKNPDPDPTAPPLNSGNTKTGSKSKRNQTKSSGKDSPSKKKSKKSPSSGGAPTKGSTKAAKGTTKTFTQPGAKTPKKAKGRKATKQPSSTTTTGSPTAKAAAQAPKKKTASKSPSATKSSAKALKKTGGTPTPATPAMVSSAPSSTVAKAGSTAPKPSTKPSAPAKGVSSKPPVPAPALTATTTGKPAPKSLGSVAKPPLSGTTSSDPMSAASPTPIAKPTAKPATPAKATSPGSAAPSPATTSVTATPKPPTLAPAAPSAPIAKPPLVATPAKPPVATIKPGVSAALKPPTAKTTPASPVAPVSPAKQAAPTGTAQNQGAIAPPQSPSAKIGNRAAPQRAATLQTAARSDNTITASVNQIPGTSPVRYAVTVRVVLGETLSASATQAGKSGQVGANASISGSVAWSKTYKFSEQEKDAYLAAVNGNTASPYQEIAAVNLWAKGNQAQAKALLRQLGGQSPKAEQILKLRKGESQDFSANAGAQTGISGSARAVSLGVSGSTSVQNGWAIAQRQDRFFVTRSFTIEKGKVLEGDVSVGLMSMGYAADTGTTQSTSVSFVVREDDPDVQEKIAAITAVASIEDLGRLALNRKDLGGSVTATTGASSGGTLRVGAGGGAISIEGQQQGFKSDSEIRDAEGNVTKVYEAGTNSGVRAKIKGHDIASVNDRSTIRTEVNRDKARGETLVEKTESDLTASAKNIASHPLASAQALAKGDTQALLKTTTVKQGANLEDDNYTRLAEQAKDIHAWREAAVGFGIDNLEAWMKLRPAVARSGVDRTVIAKLLQDFKSEGDDRRRRIIERVSDTGSGNRFEFPDAIKDQKEVFDNLVVNDPTSYASELTAAGKAAEALAELKSISSRLDALSAAINAHAGEILPTILPDMNSRITKRKTQVRAAANKLAPSPAPTVQKPGDRPAEAADDAAQKEADRKAQIDGEIKSYIADLQSLRINENAKFAEIEALFRKGIVKIPFSDKEVRVSNPSMSDILPKLGDLRMGYKKWEQKVEELKARYRERQENPDQANQYAPNWAKWNELNNRKE